MAKNDLVMNNIYDVHLNGGRRRNNPAMNQQAMTERMYVRVLTELCANRFEWQGLPDSVDVRFLELNLIWRGIAVFYKDTNSDQFFAVQGAGSGATNFLDEPTSFTVIAPDMQTTRLRAVPAYDVTPSGEPGQRLDQECVPIYCNYMREPDLDIIHLYAVKLAKLDRSIEIAADNMRKNKVIAASENERASAMAALRQIEEGQNAILVQAETGAAMISNMQVLDLGMDPLTLPNLMIARSKLWNECMGLLGINNANQDKKERLVAAEVGANDEQVEATRRIALNARQQAAKAISTLWPELTVTVDYYNQPAPTDPAPGEEFQAGRATPQQEETA